MSNSGYRFLIWDLIRSARPKQWTKNLLVFAALVFTGEVIQLGPSIRTLWAFFAMCSASSATYLVNDSMDAKRDALHPTRMHRPIASGRISVAIAWCAAGLFAIIALGIASSLGRGPLAIIATYFAVQAGYNGALKKIPVADVFAISVGFLLRAILGAAVIRVPISSWLLFCTGSLALMFGFGKRRSEFVSMGSGGAASRESLSGYSLSSLDALVSQSAAIAAVSYGIYAIESDTAHRFPGILLTVPFAGYAIARYMLLVYTKDEGGEPADLLFGDRHLLFAVIGFLAVAALSVFHFRIPFVGR